jgi:hypothetical protein
MAFFTPFNFGNPFPVVNNSQTGQTTMFLNSAPSGAIPPEWANIEPNNKPLPPTVFGTSAPNSGLAPAIPFKMPTTPGWTPQNPVIAKPMTTQQINDLIRSINTPPPPAPTMLKLTATTPPPPVPVSKPVVIPGLTPIAQMTAKPKPAPVVTKKPVAKTPVTAAKTK